MEAIVLLVISWAFVLTEPVLLGVGPYIIKGLNIFNCHDGH